MCKLLMVLFLSMLKKAETAIIGDGTITPLKMKLIGTSSKSIYIDTKRKNILYRNAKGM